MIARVRILLPYIFSVRHGDELGAHEFDYAPYRVRIFPPLRTDIDPADLEAVSPVPLTAIAERLQPAAVQAATDAIRMDGAPTIQANLLQLDFIKPEFDRRRDIVAGAERLAVGDPPMTLVFELVNECLACIRTLGRGPKVKPLDPGNTFWRVRYLSDAEEELPADPQLFRTRGGGHFSFNVNGIDADLWQKVRPLLPDYHPPIWDTLFLDAEALLPEIGPAIVLAYTALETFISHSLTNWQHVARFPPLCGSGSMNVMTHTRNHPL